jgi:hypothetical protein
LLGRKCNGCLRALLDGVLFSSELMEPGSMALGL